MKKIGYLLLQISAYLILTGGISDFLMPFFLHSLPESHLNYLQVKDSEVSPLLINLDSAFLHAIGGCLIATGIGSLIIIYACIKKNIRWTLGGLVGMVTIGEGINCSQMIAIHSPYFFFPLACIIINWIGSLLWLTGNKAEQ